jgi:hypothetical protein
MHALPLANTLPIVNGLPTPQMRVGTVSVIVTDLTKAITFSAPMPNTSYQVFIQTQSNVSVVAYPSLQTVSGFTLNLSIGVNDTFSYLAIGNS